MKKTKVNMTRFKKTNSPSLLLQTTNMQFGEKSQSVKTKNGIVTSCNKDVGIFKNIFVENSIVGSMRDTVNIPNIDTEEILNMNGVPINIQYGIKINNNNNIDENSVLTKKEIEELINAKFVELIEKKKEINNNLIEKEKEINNNLIENKLIEKNIVNEEIIQESTQEESKIIETKQDSENIEERLDEITLEEKSTKSNDNRRGRRNRRFQEEKQLDNI